MNRQSPKIKFGLGPDVAELGPFPSAGLEWTTQAMQQLSSGFWRRVTWHADFWMNGLFDGLAFSLADMANCGYSDR